MRLILRFWADDFAASSIEYAMIAAGIAVAIVAAVQSLGTTLNTTYASVLTAMK